MGVDYYKILGVNRSAKDDDLKKAYRKISEAYEVTTVVLAILLFACFDSSKFFFPFLIGGFLFICVGVSQDL